jgi:hypothetical protein
MGPFVHRVKVTKCPFRDVACVKIDVKIVLHLPRLRFGKLVTLYHLLELLWITNQM